MWPIGLIGVLLILAWVLGVLLFNISGIAANLLLAVGGLMVIVGALVQARSGRPRLR